TSSPLPDDSDTFRCTHVAQTCPFSRVFSVPAILYSLSPSAVCQHLTKVNFKGAACRPSERQINCDNDLISPAWSSSDPL
ncbi:hypothetical protein BaRGS_00039621, partial [Batillaria attramentaria]